MYNGAETEEPSKPMSVYDHDVIRHSTKEQCKEQTVFHKTTSNCTTTPLALTVSISTVLVGRPRLQEEPTRLSSFTSKSSEIHDMIIRDKATSSLKEGASLTNTVSSLSVQVSLSILDHDDYSLAQKTDAKSEFTQFPPSASTINDLVAVSAWIEPFDLTPYTYIHALHDEEHGLCFDHMASSRTKSDNTALVRLDTLDWVLFQGSGERYEVLTKTRHQGMAKVDCPCVLIHDRIGVDIGEFTRQWSGI
ncbi:hypothetical protein WAI453_009397 [Rhynchosporium graminicola]|uniref:Uncharacterized protein n=1 Tax=Rhynchosporium graminicola TaxID=2792576 RepID=A0A1E1LIG3_9HELO|nr:uncharacterized protein RCO7_02898 [Rhynchosporium commune]